MICLPNGNVVKFSQMNRTHFTIGDPMAFSIVKMGNKNPQNLPFPLHDVNPHVRQQCLGLPHAPSQTAAPTVEALSHTDAIKSPLVTTVRPKFAPKSTPSHRPIPKCHYLPHPWAYLTYDAKWHLDSIRRFSTVHWTDNVRTDRPSTGKFDDYSPLLL